MAKTKWGRCIHQLDLHKSLGMQGRIQCHQERFGSMCVAGVFQAADLLDPHELKLRQLRTAPWLFELTDLGLAKSHGCSHARLVPEMS